MSVMTTVLDTVRAELRQRLIDLRGTSAFADALAERERALGLLNSLAPVTTPELVEATPDADTADAPAEEAPAPRCDPWGNEILDAPGRFGQYRVRGTWPERVVHVCGEAATSKHLFAWDYDADERRFICRVCWPVMPVLPATAKRSA